MPEELLIEEKPIEEVKDEKASIWQRLKKWLIGGVSTAAVVGGVTVGVVQNSGHKEGDLFAINPITLDSVWFSDTTDEYKKTVEDFSRIRVLKERIVEQSVIKVDVFDSVGEKIGTEDEIIPAHVETMEQARHSEMFTAEEDGELVSILTFNGKEIAKLYYKLRAGNWLLVNKMDAKPNGLVEVKE